MRKLLVVFFALLIAGNLAAGGRKEASGKPLVRVGTAGMPAPYGWTNEDGSLDGYDQAVVHAVAELLPQYEFSLEVTEFPSIFVGLDSGRYQIGVNNISWRAERAEKYRFPEHHYIYNDTGFIVRKGRNDIKTFEDLAGKTTVVEPDGAFPQLFTEEFNAAHPANPIKVTYVQQDSLKTYLDISQGVIDFSFTEQASVTLREKEFNIDVDFISLPKAEQEKLQNPKSYFVFPRTVEGEKLAAEVDAAFARLIANGKLRELSIRYFGSDISQ
ncbi:MAG: transporter substrate-binding domain-containing protein [Spirochaetaceae bacterium]|jgi:polar amino acid transport system substrate-binding protein|nr:transporter substrate-binding domain-containing protein [Spirochaetaceae bacterium]